MKDFDGRAVSRWTRAERNRSDFAAHALPNTPSNSSDSNSTPRDPTVNPSIAHEANPSGYPVGVGAVPHKQWSKQQVLQRAVTEIEKFILTSGLTQLEFANALEISHSTFTKLLQNRQGSAAAGHKRGPRSILAKIRECPMLNSETIQAIDAYLHYSDLFRPSL